VVIIFAFLDLGKIPSFRSDTIYQKPPWQDKGKKVGWPNKIVVQNSLD
jgi:hypothetical protein